jgi:hypothetical protein
MKRFTQYLEEQLQNLEQSDTLVICDVQQEFQKYIPTGFVNNLFTYCQDFKKVYQVWDSNKASGTTWTFPNQKETFVKKYGTTFAPELKAFGQELLKKYPDVQQGQLFKFKDYSSLLVRINNNHGWFYINEDLVKFFKSLKCQRVVLVGGADLECLTDIEVGMKALGVKVMLNHEYIYNAQTSHEQII